MCIVCTGKKFLWTTLMYLFDGSQKKTILWKLEVDIVMLGEYLEQASERSRIIHIKIMHWEVRGECNDVSKKNMNQVISHIVEFQYFLEAPVH